MNCTKLRITAIGRWRRETTYMEYVKQNLTPAFSSISTIVFRK
jgi:hypothetical protein